MTTVLERLEVELEQQTDDSIRTHMINPPDNQHVWTVGMEID